MDYRQIKQRGCENYENAKQITGNVIISINCSWVNNHYFWKCQNQGSRY